jgi:hypothetical protein
VDAASAINLFIYTGHTQKNGAVSIYIYYETAPFFCVCPVYLFMLLKEPSAAQNV